jgi:hypothetical protein
MENEMSEAVFADGALPGKTRELIAVAMARVTHRALEVEDIGPRPHRPAVAGEGAPLRSGTSKPHRHALRNALPVWWTIGGSPG